MSLLCLPYTKPSAGFERVNLDLMFAIPSQTMPVWQETLRETIAMEPEHLSCYEVIYEQDTPLYEQLQAGEFDVQEELACDMFEELVRVAGEQGFYQYEVANFGRHQGVGAFDIPDEAECIPVGIKVSQTLFSGEGEHHEGEHHDHGDDHDDGKSEKDHDHDHDKDHDDHGDEVHSEFQASYLWNCHHADDLDSVQTRMMKVFPRIEEIRVQWIVGDRQGAMELENQDGKIRGWR